MLFPSAGLACTSWKTQQLALCLPILGHPQRGPPPCRPVRISPRVARKTVSSRGCSTTVSYLSCSLTCFTVLLCACSEIIQRFLQDLRHVHIIWSYDIVMIILYSIFFRPTTVELDTRNLTNVVQVCPWWKPFFVIFLINLGNILLTRASLQKIITPEAYIREDFDHEIYWNEQFVRDNLLRELFSVSVMLLFKCVCNYSIVYR